MRALLIWVLTGLLAGCSSADLPVSFDASAVKATQSRSATLSAADIAGAEVAANLEKRYRDTRDNCGAASKPAFLCTGLILRGTEASTEFDPWNPSPTSIRNGGVSFSFLRSDYNMKRLAYTYNSGFVFYPILNTPPGKLLIEILCFFPVDGSSNARPEGGCGEHPRYPTVSKSCETQTPVVDTAAKWAAKYREDAAAGKDNRESMCSFNVRDAANSAAGPRFLEGLRGGRLVLPDSFNIPNDMKLKTWAQNIPDELPIQAFIYTNSTGLAGAQFYQRRFRQLTGVTLPIIYITLPQNLEQLAAFAYRAADQTL